MAGQLLTPLEAAPRRVSRADATADQGPSDPSRRASSMWAITPTSLTLSIDVYSAHNVGGFQGAGDL